VTIFKTPLGPVNGPGPNRIVCHLSTDPGDAGGGDDGLSDYNGNDGVYTYNYRSALWSDSGCCDIYGQTEWGKDTILSFVSRHGEWMRKYDPSTFSNGWTPAMAYNREGLYIMSVDDNENNQMNVEYINGEDVNGYPTACYTLDNSWATGDGGIPIIPNPDGSAYDPIWYGVIASGLSFRPRWTL
jgi:hypothetical protein